MRAVSRLLASGVLALSLVDCSSGAICGDGTHQEGDVCLGDDGATTATTATAAAGSGGATSSSTSTAASSGGGASLLDSLPPCMPAPAPHDGSIDLTTGCVKGVCQGMTFASVNATLGAQGVCTSLGAQVDCKWSGLDIIFDDTNGDGVPDAGATTNGIFLAAPFRGTTSDGLGVGATLRCFIDSLGAPTEIEAIDDRGSIEINELQFGSFVFLVDDGTPFAGDRPDGRADSLSLFGPLP